MIISERGDELMKFYVDCTNYKLDSDRKADWVQIGEIELLFESDSHEEAIKFFDNYALESYQDQGEKLSEIQRPAVIKAISFLEKTEHATDELGFKYLEKL
jgi:hypothetical protein